MAERVRALGWKQVEVINSDLGSSTRIAAAQREGFERVISQVALGEVGIHVGSREVSRLSRRPTKTGAVSWRYARYLGP